MAGLIRPAAGVARSKRGRDEMGRLPTEASFLKDVAEHRMEVLRDDGLYRHLRFSNPKSWCMGFDVTTWPGMLCFSGDMGCYVFSRIPDMLAFFRHPVAGANRLSINPGYWSEKVQAVDHCSPVEVYSAEKFKARIKEWMKDCEWPRQSRAEAAREVLLRAEDGEHAAMSAALEFEHDGHRFDCFYECNVKEYSYRFLWCCYALAWAVRQYDGRDVQADALPLSSPAGAAL